MTKNFVLIFLFFDSLVVSAQYDLSGLDLDGDVTTWFDQAIGKENLAVVSGDYFVVRNGSKNTHQFYESYRWSTAQINYQGGRYEEISALYDVLNDQLLIKHPSLTKYGNHPIQGHKPKFRSFSIHGHLFKYHEVDSCPHARAGYYDQLFIGEHLEFIAKRKKETTIFDGENFLGYKPVDQYFLKYEDQFYGIKGKRSIIKPLILYKKQLKQFIRQSAIRVSSEGDLNDSDVIELVKYADKMMSEK